MGEIEGDIPGEVEGDALGKVEGNPLGEVEGDPLGEVEGDVLGKVEGDVLGLGVVVAVPPGDLCPCVPRRPLLLRFWAPPLPLPLPPSSLLLPSPAFGGDPPKSLKTNPPSPYPRWLCPRSAAPTPACLADPYLLRLLLRSWVALGSPLSVVTIPAG